MLRGAEPVNPNTIAHRVAANPPRNITRRLADDMKGEISGQNLLRLSFGFVDGVTTFIFESTFPNEISIRLGMFATGLRVVNRQVD